MAGRFMRPSRALAGRLEGGASRWGHRGPSRMRLNVSTRKRSRGSATTSARSPDPPRRGLAHALKVRKPAHAMLNIATWRGDAAPPFDPPACRAAADAAGGRCVPRQTVAPSWSPPASTPGGARRLRGCGSSRWRGRERGPRPARALSASGAAKPRVIANDRNQSAAGRTRTPQRSADLLRGSKGPSPSPAPAGDPRSVAPKGRLALPP